MSGEWIGPALALFGEACELPPGDRAAFLDRACGGDAGLRRHVEAMLAADAAADPEKAGPEVPAPVREALADLARHAASADSGAAAIPETIDGYRIVRLIAQGGMGSVYLAEQTGPICREVALKVINPGMDSRQVIARFQLERQALAMMSHPAIARVFDAGITAQGHPYFVMEYVDGTALTDYCDHHRLTLPQRIGIFQSVCRAVQHAHQKGILHRDLKPGNILVARKGDEHTVKIIDFGLARAIDRSLSEDAIHTEQGLLLGTPEYMSPEQAGGGAQDIDTRTDVYSLGVVLYELLAGELPFTSQELRRATFREMQRILTTVEPKKPSTKVSSVGAKASTWAERRRLSVPALRRRLKGDLDWIVLRAMAKEPERRYSSALDLALDLGRHLAHEPVQAGPPGAGYRLSRFARRHRILVGAAALILAVSVAGTVVAWRYAAEAVREREESDRQEGIARAENARFHRLSVVVKIEEATATLKDLVPAWPDQVPALRSWIGKYRELEAELPKVRQTIRDLEEREPLPSSGPGPEDPPEYSQDPAFVTQQKKVAALRRALDVHSGRSAVPVLELPEDTSTDVDALRELAWPLVSPVPKDRVWGQEALGLALARRLREVAPGTPQMYGERLTLALFANGLFAETVAACEEAVAEAPLEEKWVFERLVGRLKAKIDAAPGTLEHAEAQMARMDGDVVRRAGRLLRDGASQFLYEAMVRAENDLVRFLGDRGAWAEARRRLAWAEQIRSLTHDHPGAKVTWAQAQEALRNADGVTASERYAERYHESHPIDLTEQMGLVPIGMNPVTGLWEFYHLRSAYDLRRDEDPRSIPIPAHKPDGSIEVTDDTGIVFVLLPGGTFNMGAQNADPHGVNYDPLARRIESQRRVTVPPFFLARHELTQGQWLRLSSDPNPSSISPEAEVYPDKPVTLRHPVDSLDWWMSDALLGKYRLFLPSDEEWEYACRAGTDTPWHTGADPRSLEHYENLLDRGGTKGALLDRGVRPGEAADFDDGRYDSPAPVGSYLANGFGLHDMAGNVREWCRHQHGLRFPFRGGSFGDSPLRARSALLDTRAPTMREHHLGLRAARALH